MTRPCFIDPLWPHKAFLYPSVLLIGIGDVELKNRKVGSLDFGRFACRVAQLKSLSFFS